MIIGLLSQITILLAAFCVATPGAAMQSDAKSTDDSKLAKEIESILKVQAGCWNRKDIDGFMQTYWKSEKLTFSSGGNTTRGWQATLDRYKTNYPPEKMGELTFDNLETTVLAEGAALVLGQWHLQVPENNSGGNFSLVLKKIEGKWKIVHDHSSSLPETK